MWALIVQNLRPERALGKAIMQIWSAAAGADFKAKLDAYASRERGRQPDFKLQSELLKTIGEAVIPFFARMGIPVAGLFGIAA